MATEAEIELGEMEVIDGETYRITVRFRMDGGDTPVLQVGCRTAPLKEWAATWATIAYEEEISLIQGTGGDDPEDLFIAAAKAARGEVVHREIIIIGCSTVDQAKVCARCGKTGTFNPSKRWADIVTDNRGWPVCRNQPCNRKD